MNKLSFNIYRDLETKVSNNTLTLVSLPDVILKIDAALKNNVNHHDVVKIIQTDISLSSRIIQIANSPALRGNNEVTSLSEGINRLGFSLIKSLAVCVLLQDSFLSKNVKHRKFIKKLLTNSIEQSIVGSILTQELTPKLSPSISLLCGLVCKLGPLVIVRYCEESSEFKHLSIEEIEEVIYEVGDVLTEDILRKWEFPTQIIAGIFDVEYDISNPKTYRDIFELSTRYCNYKRDELPVISQYQHIDTLLTKHSADISNLKETLMKPASF